jgi:uncharacterized membrane protein YfcA
MNILKSVWAVLAGFLVVGILSSVTDSIVGADISTKMLALALVYRSIYTFAGGYITARLAPQNPMKHVLVLAGIGFAAGVVGVFAGWDLSAHWYPIAIAITGPLFVWLGGRYRVR